MGDAAIRTALAAAGDAVLTRMSLLGVGAGPADVPVLMITRGHAAAIALAAVNAYIQTWNAQRGEPSLTILPAHMNDAAQLSLGIRLSNVTRQTNG